MPSTQSHRQIAVAVEGLADDSLLCRSMTIREQLGTPFEIRMRLLSEDTAIGLDAVLGKGVTIRAQKQGSDTPRYFSGLIVGWSSRGRSRRYAAYEALVVPALWLLSRRASCRIFQHQTVVEIVKAVCAGVESISVDDSALERTYSPYEFKVQYRETDLAFVSRLLEHEGIYYFFRHEQGSHKMVLCDSASAHHPAPGFESVKYHDPTPAAVDQGYITEWATDAIVQSGSYAHTDYDPLNPKTDLLSRVRASASGDWTKLEVYDYPGGHADAGDGELLARIRLEEIRAGHEQSNGLTDSRGITVGCTFALAEHPRADFDAEYLVVSSTITVESDAFESEGPYDPAQEKIVWSCDFRALSSQVQFRPARATPRPRIAGPQTAFVVGKSGEEVDVDAEGRVRVMFHWDLGAPADDTCSLPVRVAEAWAGRKWGSVFIPRVGQEVVVEFLEGDPDRPLITGRLYNSANKPPYDLPANKTISAIKSSSSKGGSGFNEIRFEDKKDSEQVFLHAQKNMDTRVTNDAFETIGHDRHLTVANDQVELVKNDRHEAVTRDHVEEIGRDRHVAVKGKEAVKVTGTKSLTVEDDVIEVFKKNHSEQVTKDLYVKAENIVIEATTNVTIKVGQSFIAIEAGGIKIGTTGEIVLDASANITQKAGASVAVEANASATVKGSAGVTIESPAVVEAKGSMVKAGAMLSVG